jgi:hypothetical protein
VLPVRGLRLRVGRSDETQDVAMCYECGTRTSGSLGSPVALYARVWGRPEDCCGNCYEADRTVMGDASRASQATEVELGCVRAAQTRSFKRGST